MALSDDSITIESSQPSIHSSSKSSNETKDCIYCMVKENNHPKLGKLIKLCKCNLYAHEKCIAKRYHGNIGERKDKCDVCHHPFNYNIEIHKRKYMQCFFNIFLCFYHPIVVITSIGNIFCVMYWHSLIDFFDTPTRRLAIFLPLTVLIIIFICIYLKIYWNGSRYTFGTNIFKNFKLWILGNFCYLLTGWLFHLIGSAVVCKDKCPEHYNLATFWVGFIDYIILLVFGLLLAIAGIILFEKLKDKCSEIRAYRVVVRPMEQV